MEIPLCAVDDVAQVHPNSPTLMNAGGSMAAQRLFCAARRIRLTAFRFYKAHRADSKGGRRHRVRLSTHSGPRATTFVPAAVRPVDPISFWRAFSEATNAIQQGPSGAAPTWDDEHSSILIL